jgi:hypothetical protein
MADINNVDTNIVTVFSPHTLLSAERLHTHHVLAPHASSLRRRPHPGQSVLCRPHKACFVVPKIPAR